MALARTVLQPSLGFAAGRGTTTKFATRAGAEGTLGAVAVGRRLTVAAGERAGQAQAQRELRQQLLDTAVGLVPQYGWTVLCLGKAAEAVGLNPMAHGLCPDGPVALVEHFLQTSRRQTAQQLEAMPLDGLGVGQRVRTGIVTRLQHTMPLAAQWPQALAVMGSSGHGRLVLAGELAALADELWHQAGDTATDFGWYTKRVALMGVYSSTELFLAQDQSAGFEATLQFLDRRLADVAGLGSLRSQVEQTAGTLVGVAGSLAYTTRALAGWQR
eukprot:comp24232_c2_seq4/m.44684 comp24232_c2_seq4/g.44684  ORF comp24232_c2_seq4/g.44684 comp24232_c2_seq4/m.44684 type:complete len:272 (-) comp24232_c2_seq4:422-1237(-)